MNSWLMVSRLKETIQMNYILQGLCSKQDYLQNFFNRQGANAQKITSQVNSTMLIFVVPYGLFLHWENLDIFLLFKDDYNSYQIVYFIKAKSETYSYFLCM